MERVLPEHVEFAIDVVFFGVVFVIFFLNRPEFLRFRKKS